MFNSSGNTVSSSAFSSISNSRNADSSLIEVVVSGVIEGGGVVGAVVAGCSSIGAIAYFCFLTATRRAIIMMIMTIPITAFLFFIGSINVLIYEVSAFFANTSLMLCRASTSVLYTSVILLLKFLATAKGSSAFSS